MGSATSMSTGMRGWSTSPRRQRRLVAQSREPSSSEPATSPRFPGGSDRRASRAARVAGLLGAKQTASLIPLCHPLPLSALSVEFEAVGDDVEVSAVAETFGQTGVEMEALTACALASPCQLLAEVSPARAESADR